MMVDQTYVVDSGRECRYGRGVRASGNTSARCWEKGRATTACRAPPPGEVVSGHPGAPRRVTLPEWKFPSVAALPRAALKRYARKRVYKGIRAPCSIRASHYWEGCHARRTGVDTGLWRRRGGAVRAPDRIRARFDANDDSESTGSTPEMLSCAPGRAHEEASLNKVMRTGRRSRTRTAFRTRGLAIAMIQGRWKTRCAGASRTCSSPCWHSW